MELQISHSVCTEVQKKSVLQRKKTGGRRNSKNTVQLEEDKNRRGRSLPGPCAYVGRDTSKGGDIKLHGISQREKQSDDL